MSESDDRIAGLTETLLQARIQWVRANRAEELALQSHIRSSEACREARDAYQEAEADLLAAIGDVARKVVGL